MSRVLATNLDTVRLARSMGSKNVEAWFDAALPQDFFAAEPRHFKATGSPLRLVWIGRMVPRKALPLTLDVMVRVQQPATLTVIGDGLPPEEIHRMIAERKLGERVNWMGKLGREQVREIYLNHDALLFAGLRDSCPAQLIEAMGVGLPVITLDHHGAADLVPDGAGLKVPVSDMQGLIRNMALAIDRYAVTTAEERAAMSETGWRYARDLNYTAGAERFERLYREVLHEPKSRDPRADSSTRNTRAAAPGRNTAGTV